MVVGTLASEPREGPMTAADRPTDAAMRDRFYQEIADDLDDR
jgi:hypothetical protein